MSNFSKKIQNVVLIFFSIILLRIFNISTCFENFPFRLPRDVVPFHYGLQLHPDFTTKLFSGEVTIAIEVLNVKSFIALHAKDLIIKTVRLSKVEQVNDTFISIQDVMVKNIFLASISDILLLETMSPLLVGQYWLHFAFDGRMSKNQTGIFTMSYFDCQLNETRNFVTTRFEPIHARRAFPCFDEPRFKASFEISLVQPNLKGYHSLSNMPIKHSMPNIPVANETTIYFEKTLPIPTYLVAFVMSDFTNRSSVIPGHWEHYRLISTRAWTSFEKMINLDFIIHMTYRSINHHMHLFRINYPLSKIDAVGVPGFLSFTMENWGLVLYEGPTTLYFERSNSINDFKISANRISYASANFWFGALVTMRWWNHVWLSKSFATFMQFYTTNWVYPHWKELETFIVDFKFPSMESDALTSSLPIFWSVETTGNVEHFVNAVPKIKGASVLWMLCRTMGDYNFFHGVGNYLQAYRFNTAVTNDFVNSLNNVHTSGENLTRLVDTWIKQDGFPVLRVEKIGDVYYIDQSRFLLNRQSSYNSSLSPYSYHWDLPIFYTTSMNNGTKQIFFSHDAPRIQLLVNEDVNWVKFNTNSIGYFIVNYDLRSWDVFSEIIRNTPQQLTILDRIDLINDAFFNANAGNIPYRVPISMFQSVKFRTDYISWKLMSNIFLYLRSMLESTEILKQFEEYVRNFVRPIYMFLGWQIRELDTFELRRLRVVILKLACVVRMKECVEEVSEKFRSFISNTNVRPHPDIRQIVYYYGMKHADPKDDWEKIYFLFLSEPDLYERQRFMISLTAVQDPEIFLNFLEVSKIGFIMSSKEYLTMFSAATLNPVHSTILWDFYTNCWDTLSSKYHYYDPEFSRLAVSITSNFRDDEEYEMVSRFFEEHPHSELTAAARKRALEMIRNRAIWTKNNYPQIRNWLSQEE